MRRLPVLAGALLALVPVTIGAAKPAAAPDILYALDAKGAVIAPSGGSLRLSLPANTIVTWFTDRPVRRAGAIRLTEFTAMWKASGLMRDPPNAALLTTANGVENTHVVEMTKPVSARGRVSFAIRAIPDGAVAGHLHTNDLAPGRFARARVFIDGATLIP